ncbi:DHH family phosphoesterase [Candidatus Woesearchaeota archaeon]|nr:DHH family phosphoesterase [Candidatus Woesearchaeota archaeon]
MLTEKEIKQIKEELNNCKRPIFFFHDDPDGLASFLLLYRRIHEGKGVIVKAYPKLNTMFAEKALNYEADKVFVLDIANVEQEFIDMVKIPVIWIDHHPPIKRDKIKYFNPRLRDNLNIPVSYLCHQIVKQDDWIALIGCLGDWYIPNFFPDFANKNPELVNKAKKIGEILFETKMGELVKILSFNLKGNTSEVNKSIKILTRIDNPEEILEQTTPRGKLIYKKYEQIQKHYKELLKKAMKAKKGKIIVFTYSEDKLSLTKDLANELMYLNPDKVIVLGREKSGEVRCSIRANNLDLTKAIPKALIGIEGYGGGHEKAGGAGIKKEDFKQFLKNLEKEIK